MKLTTLQNIKNLTAERDNLEKLIDAEMEKDCAERAPFKIGQRIKYKRGRREHEGVICRIYWSEDARFSYGVERKLKSKEGFKRETVYYWDVSEIEVIAEKPE